ncbi:MAG: serine hydrolase domain-containing protein [Bacteroidota bacterium]
MIYRILQTGLLCGIFCFFTQCTNSNPRIEKIEGLFSNWNNQDSPGCAVWVYHKGKIAYQNSFGMANISDSIPIESSTQFHVASITKQFTGMAIAILEERGLINKDEELIKYIAEIPNYGASIKIHHLLNHTSGIPEYQYLEDLAGIDGRKGISRETFFELLHSKTSLNNHPGERYIYSNSNYVLLALIVEKVAHMTFPEFVKREIFIPLNMQNSAFASELKPEKQKQLARGYAPGYQIEEPSINAHTIVGDGGIITDIGDLGLWVKALITQKLPVTDSLIQRPSSGHYNYGLQYFYHNGLPSISHGGVHFGFRSNILIFPDQDFFVIILANIDHQDFFYNNYSIADIFLEDSYKKADTRTDFISDVDVFTGKFTSKYFDEVIMIGSADSALHISNYQKGEKYTAYQSNENTFISLSASGQRTYLFNQKRDSLEIVDYDGSTKVFHRAEDFQSPSSLKDLAGTYLSQDTGFRLSLTIDDKGFINSDFDSEYFNNFQPLTSEIWMNQNINMMTMRFHQEEGKVTAFSLSTDRLKNLRFDRLR